MIAFLLHASFNGAGEFFVGLFDGADRVRMYWILTAVCAVIVTVAIAQPRSVAPLAGCRRGLIDPAQAMVGGLA